MWEILIALLTLQEGGMLAANTGIWVATLEIVKQINWGYLGMDILCLVRSLHAKCSQARFVLESSGWGPSILVHGGLK
jgi:hypothetical protein